MIKIRASFCNQKSALLATFEFQHTIVSYEQKYIFYRTAIITSKKMIDAINDVAIVPMLNPSK